MEFSRFVKMMMMMLMLALIPLNVHSGKSIREPIPLNAMAYGRLSDHQTHKYCHHRAACGTRAQPGPLISVNDPSSAQDGFQCACFGKDALGSVTASCYRGVCDYGRARHTIRGRAVDEVLDMKREEDEEFNPNKHADQEGLCKFVQNLDNLVDSRMCLSHLNPTSGADELNTDTVSDIPRINVPAFTKALVEAAKSSDPPLPSTLQERIDAMYYMDLKNKKDQEVTT